MNLVEPVKKFWRDHPVISNLILMAVVGLIIVWAVMIFLSYWTLHGHNSVVPDIKHKTYAEAGALLKANNLNIEISDSIYDRSLAPGTIVESWPKAGAVVKADRQVYVTVTAFSPKQVTISMPLTGNVSSRQAISYLRGVGITDVQLSYVPSEFPDLVMGARYGDTPLSVGSVIPVTATITLEIGNGPAEESDSTAVDDPEIFSDNFDVYQ